MMRGSDVVRWREGDVVHADSGDGHDFTLCGYALEGACDGYDSECVEIYRGKIDCPKCLHIISYSKSIPASVLANPTSPRERASRE